MYEGTQGGSTMDDHCAHKRREPEPQEMPNSLVVPCGRVPLLQSVESSLIRVPLSVRFPVLSPGILCFVPKRIFKPLCFGHLRKDRPIPGDTHAAVRRSARRNQRDSRPPTTLTLGARLISYPMQMRARN